MLFAEYVRMLRARDDVDWRLHLPPEDIALLATQIDEHAWYPMPTFERYGNAILWQVAGGQLGSVRQWGRTSIESLTRAQPLVLAHDDPRETLSRFRSMRASWFDFDVFQVPALLDDECEVSLLFGLGMPAEEAAVWQCVGMVERLIDLAGGKGVRPAFLAQSWKGHGERTRVRFQWEPPY